jgi:hypothetical protein
MAAAPAATKRLWRPSTMSETIAPAGIGVIAASVHLDYQAAPNPL